MNKGPAVIIVVLVVLLIICVTALTVSNKRLNLERQEKTRLEAELNALSEELRAVTVGIEAEGEVEDEGGPGEEED
jgi:biopolymer transport protein ExbD